MKQYKAVFFDWDGTAVLSRKAPADDVIRLMKPLLAKKIHLVIVSGTTIENIAAGKLSTYFTTEEKKYLYLGLGRGAYNYAFNDAGEPYVFHDMLPDKKLMSDIHRICFDIHIKLLEQYHFKTDIVFSRPNYCKIDLMADSQRGESLFMQEDELTALKDSLKAHGIHGGLQELLNIALETGRNYGVQAVPTCDAKYLEVGISSKSDNVDIIFGRLSKEYGIRKEDCAYWGDEYVGIEPEIFGSDSFMMTEMTKGGDFFDVSKVPGKRPEGVELIGGGVTRFLDFLKTQNL